MKDKTYTEPTISRRGLFTLLGSLMAAPLLSAKASEPAEEQEYVTVLKSDGTTVRIPKQIEKEARVVNAHVSNKKMLNWINRKS